MRKNNRGISLISLMVIIISIIIISSIAITAGYRFITESQEAEKTALINIISEAAYRRQNDYNTDQKNYYAGKMVLDDDVKSANFKNLPGSEELSELRQKLNGVEPIWFVLDGSNAENLGVSSTSDYKKYIVSDLSSESTKYSPVALVEYITGTTYLVEINNEFANTLDIIQDHESNHEPIWSVATCFEPKKCAICGATQGSPTPHLIAGLKRQDDGTYKEITEVENVPNDEIKELVELGVYKGSCTQPLKCKRCETVFASATGHDFLNAEYEYDAVNHWKECNNGCGTKEELEAHTKSWISMGDSLHAEKCSTCDWQSAETSHNIVVENVDGTNHKKYCSLCELSEIHHDSGWKKDKYYHWKECNTCNNNELFKEKHIDSTNSGICDVCGRRVDLEPPKAFTPGSLLVTEKTTHQISVSAKTVDNDGGVGLSRYECSYDNGLNWNPYPVDSDSQTASWKFNNLNHNEQYNIRVRAYDKEENFTEGQITVNTYEVPAQLVNSSLSTEGVMTRNNVTVTLNMPTISLPDAAKNQLIIIYKINDENDWHKYETPLTISDEATTIVQAKLADKREPFAVANKSSLTKNITISNIDKTAPTISIESANVDSITTSRNAIVKVSDEKAGIAKDTLIYYKWTTDSQTAPTTYTDSYKVTEKSKNVSFELKSPEGVKGKYYLWIKSGVSDDIGNATTSDYVSPMYFDIDDIAPQLTEITMRNKETDAVDELYVRSGKKITINMKADKALSKGPLVEIITTSGSKQARATSSDGINWVAQITADEAFTEGLLDNVKISDYVSRAGKAGEEYRNTTDGKYVTYDKTTPSFEYIN